MSIINCNSSLFAVAAAKRKAWFCQRRLSRYRKSAKFGNRKIDADQADPRSLWESDDSLLGRGHMPASDLTDVDSLDRMTKKTQLVGQRDLIAFDFKNDRLIYSGYFILRFISVLSS